MQDLEYIAERDARELIIREGRKGVDNGTSCVKNPVGFSGHLINVGNTAHEVAERILDRHLTLFGCINPEIVRVAGYMHDFAKMGYGKEAADLEYSELYHDITGAHLILEKGEEFGLVSKGSESDRREALRRIAICLPGDWTFEELEQKAYGETPSFKEMTDYLRRNLSTNDCSLSLIGLSTPTSLERQIAVYADVVDNEDRSVAGALKRIEEMCVTYDKYVEEATGEGKNIEALYFRTQARISRTPEFKSKMATIVSNINQLAEI